MPTIDPAKLNKADLIVLAQSYSGEIDNLRDQIDDLERAVRRAENKAEAMMEKRDALARAIRLAKTDAKSIFDTVARMKYRHCEKDQWGTEEWKYHESEYTEEMKALEYMRDMVTCIVDSAARD
jgi:cell fate (sporulation/competence/biofilm development) regulator YlbF (YheA/YmcA/DUF963 family)